ncbi:MAG TPA: hypothetical protein VHZ06_09920 [Marmoricola sp.]|nr:hypothetical protein [Marmoricola sp.]
MTPRAIDVRTAQRSLVATLEITGLATGAHLLAGGAMPAPGFLLALGLVVLACSLAAIGRLVRLRYVVPFVLVAQVGLHAAFEATAPMGGMGTMGGSQPASMAGFPAWLHLTPMMFWAHLVTAVLSAIILVTQERAVAAVTGWLRRLSVDANIAPLLARADAPAAEARGKRRVLLSTSPRRGPPALLRAPSSVVLL